MLPNATTLNVTFFPAPSQAGTTALLSWSSTGGTVCQPAVASVAINVQAVAGVKVGSFFSLCSNDAARLLAVPTGSATGGLWSGASPGRIVVFLSTF